MFCHTKNQDNVRYHQLQLLCQYLQQLYLTDHDVRDVLHKQPYIEMKENIKLNHLFYLIGVCLIKLFLCLLSDLKKCHGSNDNIIKIHFRNDNGCVFKIE